ncbi:hypothetical protein J437_LFUL018480 [Ladona fulva]|uniref:Uncharacterized protein n=1 Tax=Ladona fulva TaxID=123851 RepID=A0A8K0P6W5_LADFU|nr:hypothetical protein J437_LFUL018480 [Ladona fulva]
MILTRWRFYKFVFSADIVKMFRSILVQEEDIQRIIWRSDPTQPTGDYNRYLRHSLSTIRTLLQLAEDEEELFPKGSTVLRSQTYVGDIFSGGDTIEDTLNSQSVVTKRTILFQITKLFDPLGWLSPVLITAKILLQNSWILGLNWDTPIREKLGPS